MEWILLNAKQFSDFIGLAVIIATGGVWVARRVVFSIKKLESVLKNQNEFTLATAELKASVDDVRKQLKPNGGTSIFDIINDVKKKSAETSSVVSEISEGMTKMRAYQWGFVETVTEKPVFEANEQGHCVRVNAAYAKLAERNSPELLGNGWENFVCYSDRARVFEEWSDAIARKRIFESKYKVQSKNGKSYSVDVTAIPVLDDNGKVAAYIGRFDNVKEVVNG